jgi:hypothetical protein
MFADKEAIMDTLKNEPPKISESLSGQATLKDPASR